MAKKTNDGARFVATRCEISIAIKDRDDMVEFLAVQASSIAESDERDRILRFLELIRSGELV